MTTTTQTDHIIPTYRRWPIEIASGSGCTVVDTTGRSYLDMTAGIAVAAIGHAHPVVAAAIGEQAARLVHVSNLYTTRPQSELSDRLASLTGGMLSFFSNSGAEAVECALKLARKRGGPSRTRVVATEGGFHGRTFGALSATGQPKKKEAFEPLVPGFTHVAYADVDALEAAMGSDVAAVVLEPIQGEAGVVVPAPGYLAAARELCDRHGSLLVLDEIQTGLGRTGRWFAHQHTDVTPDVMCLAKALAGGLPMGACLATPDAASAFEIGDHATTFGGGPVQAAAALATLDVIENEGLVDNARVMGTALMDALDGVFGARSQVRGKGLLIGIELDRPLAREIAARCLEHGLLVNDATPSVVRLTPPLVVTANEIDHAMTILEEVWDEVATS